VTVSQQVLYSLFYSRVLIVSLSTTETGGWSTRELRTIIRGLEDLLIVGADVVEVSTPYDSQAELTVQAAADVLYEVMSLMVKKGPLVAQ
jgi:agmatinase